MKLRALFKRTDKSLPGPSRPYETDAGTDLIALEPAIIEFGETKVVPSNISVALPDGYYAMVAGRSSVNARGVLTHIGTVDQGYRGIISVAMTNLGKQAYIIERGDRIAQLVILPFLSPEFVEVDELPPSPRADKGWGSSGQR